RSFGSYAGGAIRLTRGASGKAWGRGPEGEEVAIAEGIEDALTFAVARPDMRTAAAVSGSNMRGLKLPAQLGRVILIAQNEGPNSKTDWDKTAEAFRAQGRPTRILRPPVFVKDLNELAQRALAESSAAAQQSAAGASCAAIDSASREAIDLTAPVG